MTKPYSIPAASKSQDVVISGSVFEHIPFFWASMLEVARVLRPGGLWFVTVPSRGHKHSAIDCWRFYPDGLRAMAAASHLTLLESHVHYPPMTEDARHDYPRIDAKNHYWGDAVAVYRKPERYPLEMHAIRPVVRWWANRAGGQGPARQHSAPADELHDLTAGPLRGGAGPLGRSARGAPAGADARSGTRVGSAGSAATAARRSNLPLRLHAAGRSDDVQLLRQVADPLVGQAVVHDRVDRVLRSTARGRGPHRVESPAAHRSCSKSRRYDSRIVSATPSARHSARNESAAGVGARQVELACRGPRS